MSPAGRSVPRSSTKHAVGRVNLPPLHPLAIGVGTVYKDSMTPALDDILQRHPVWRGGLLACSAPAVPSGFAELDRELPGGGWPVQALTEILCRREGIGELQLVLPALAALSWAG